MAASNVSTLINPQNGNLAFKIFSFEDNHAFDHLQRHNYYSVILIEQGTYSLKADMAEYALEGAAILCFAPYQPFMIRSNSPVRGWALHFHPDFFCIHKHEREVACNSVLFNTVYEPPFLALEAQEQTKFGATIAEMLREMHNNDLAQYELLVAQLKIFLIHATRLKRKFNAEKAYTWVDAKEPMILQNLKDALEHHYRTKHSARDYADLLNISPKALAKITKRYYHKTLTDIISERIVIEAKRELYLTSKTVKEIAYELGFNDEHYFSRFFKTNADVSPQTYRDTVGFARAEML
ncbi:MAG: helix-turn-helix domain-containing protein [Candidatus Kapaibacteriota bacterium]|jgi:AraC family transcriptional activator of pobA